MMGKGETTKTRTITAQDTRHAGHNRTRERMEVYLVLRAVVQIGCRLSSTMLLLAGAQDSVSVRTVFCMKVTTHLSMKCLAQACVPPCCMPSTVS